MLLFHLISLKAFFNQLLLTAFLSQDADNDYQGDYDLAAAVGGNAGKTGKLQ